MQVPLVKGRLFDRRDTTSSAPVAVVNETFVRQFLDPATAIGSHVRTLAEPEYPSVDREVIGIVRDTKYGSLRDETPPAHSCRRASTRRRRRGRCSRSGARRPSRR
jgi:hypothetical protein